MRILIVEDHIELADILNESLSHYIVPHQDIVGIAYDGLQAVHMIIDKEPDIVFLDLVMPKLDGLGVLKEVNRLNLKKRPYFVVLSALGSSSFVKQAMELGAEFYIVKPFRIAAIVELFERIQAKVKRQ